MVDEANKTDFDDAPGSAPTLSQPRVDVGAQPGGGSGLVADTPGDDGDVLEGQIVAVRYRVLRKIGEGGMGAVYLAEHVTIEKRVALKVLLHEHARRPETRERFLQEAKAAARIGHENVVDIIDFGQTPNGAPFFAMEHLDGRDLAKVIQMDGPLPWQRAKPILLQICRALDAAHQKGIIHRDMKPENVFLEIRDGAQDFVKILDFGIAKVGQDAEGGSRLTRTGTVFGTPQYMSPEQAQGKKVDNRVDVYAVGCIAYEMLSGEVPFSGDSFMGILNKHITETPRPLREISSRADLPAGVEQIVMKALAKSPEHRFQSMAEMAVALSRVGERGSARAIASHEGEASESQALRDSGAAKAAGRGTTARVAEVPAQGRTRPLARLLSVAALAIAAVVIALGTFLLLRGGGPAGGDFAAASSSPAPATAAQASQHETLGGSSGAAGGGTSPGHGEPAAGPGSTAQKAAPAGAGADPARRPGGAEAASGDQQESGASSPGSAAREPAPGRKSAAEPRRRSPGGDRAAERKDAVEKSGPGRTSGPEKVPDLIDPFASD